MDDQLSTPSSVGNKSFSYNSYLYTYYIRIDGNYYPVYRVDRGTYNNRYALYYIDRNGDIHYLRRSNNPDEILYTGTFYTGSRMDALKNSVKNFINIIAENDSKLSAGVGHNQISIVKFASAKNTNVGNNFYDQYGVAQYYANYSQTVVGFQDVFLNDDGTDGAGVKTLKDAVDALIPGGATSSDYGMQLASGLFTDDISENNKRTVVMFTDGVPTHSGSIFDRTVANGAVTAAKEMKDDGISVITVGVFGGTPADDVTNYMNRVSSNYPDATSYTNGNRGEGDYYYTASTEEQLLEAFKAIAAQSGADIPLDDTAEVRDEVTQSFNVVNDASAVRVYKIQNVGNANGIVWSTTHTPADEVTLTWTQGSKNINVKGFNYMDNWVGYDFIENQPHGYKLVIEIDITIDPDAVGGKQVNTNTADSGIYYKDENNVEQHISFPIPKLSIPITIQIKKHGLRNGESASFSIFRVLDDTSKDEDYYANPEIYPADPYMVVNITGTTDEWVLKLIKALDPNYVYMIKEAGWSWAY